MSTTDEKTIKLIEEIRRRREEIVGAERPQWKTNCSFQFYDGGKPTNLHVTTDVGLLVRIAAFIKSHEKGYEEAAKQLGVEAAPPFTWSGFSVADWISDIQTRLNKVQIAEKKKKLDALESRLNSIVSPELRAKLELEAIEAELKA